jgi:hypothetical protein
MFLAASLRERTMPFVIMLAEVGAKRPGQHARSPAFAAMTREKVVNLATPPQVPDFDGIHDSREL